MILVQYKLNGLEGVFAELEMKDKILKGKIIFKETVSEDEEPQETSLDIPEKDLSSLENSLYVLIGNQGKIEWIDGYRFTESYRDRLSYLQKMLNTNILLIVKVGKKEAEDLNVLLETTHIFKENFTLKSDMEVQEETPELIDGHVYSKYDRRKIFPCYALVLNGQEYQADDEGTLLNAKDITVPYTGDNITLRIKKYDYEFGKTMNDTDDTDKVYIQSTCGIINARMAYLENGEKELRFNPLDYEGDFTIKIGWRWNPVVNQYDLKLKKVEGKGD